MKFSIKDLFSNCDQIRSFLRIWSYLLKKSLMENFIFRPVFIVIFSEAVGTAGTLDVYFQKWDALFLRITKLKTSAALQPTVT